MKLLKDGTIIYRQSSEFNTEWEEIIILNKQTKIKIVKKNIGECNINKKEIIWDSGFDFNPNSTFYILYIGDKEYTYFTVKDCGLYVNSFLWFTSIWKPVFNTDYISRFIFQTYPFCNKISTHILESNWFGIRFLKKSGFIIEVKLRNHFLIGNKKVDCYIMSKFRTQT